MSAPEVKSGKHLIILRSSHYDPKRTGGQSLRLHDLRVVERLCSVDQGRNNPARDENADNREAEIREVVVQASDEAPEPTFESELVANQAEGFHTTDEESDNYRRRRDREVVPELSDWVHEGPTISAGHQCAV